MILSHFVFFTLRFLLWIREREKMNNCLSLINCRLVTQSHVVLLTNYIPEREREREVSRSWQSSTCHWQSKPTLTLNLVLCCLCIIMACLTNCHLRGGYFTLATFSFLINHVLIFGGTIWAFVNSSLTHLHKRSLLLFCHSLTLVMTLNFI